MTDKQIIFKCDVDCIRKNTEECFELDCIKGQESILKQLQAKEQECERLKAEYTRVHTQLASQEAYMLVDGEEVWSGPTRKLKQENDQLKAENEELKNFHINLVGVKECEIKELLKLKQTLTEIKEIADIINDRTMVASYICDHLDKILQKISECEVTNDMENN